MITLAVQALQVLQEQFVDHVGHDHVMLDVGHQGLDESDMLQVFPGKNVIVEGKAYPLPVVFKEVATTIVKEFNISDHKNAYQAIFHGKWQ